MIYQGAELYNIHELLAGDGRSVIGDRTMALLRQQGGDPDAVWGAEDDQGLWFTRIPNELRLQLNVSAQLNALQSTGAELRFNLLGDQARLALKCHQAQVAVEVYQGCFCVGWHVIGRQRTEIVIRPPDKLELLARLSVEHQLPFDARLTRVLLPWRPPARLLEFAAEVEPPRPDQVPARRYLAYGSSITHGNFSVRPSGMYAHRVAQLLGVDLINLGFGGGACLEPEIADYIAGRQDWDFASLELGINLLRQVEPEEFARRVDYFVERIGRAHGDKWIFCMDLFTVEEDLTGDPAAEVFRRIVADKVRALGLPRLVHVPGRQMLESVSGLMVDLVHPSAFGMEEIARNLAGRMRAVMSPG
jgi:lysophospholipase L1-like esterase